jgi:hypothetical protein
MAEQQTHIYLNPVATDRAAEFEKFMVEVAAPAVRAQRPDLADRWRLLRATAPEASDPSVITYALVFDGGSLAEDWELDNLLPAHFGQEEADRLGASWMETFIPLQQWVGALAAREDGPQIGWTFTSVGP